MSNSATVATTVGASAGCSTAGPGFSAGFGLETSPMEGPEGLGRGGSIAGTDDVAATAGGAPGSGDASSLRQSPETWSPNRQPSAVRQKANSHVLDFRGPLLGMFSTSTTATANGPATFSSDNLCS